MADDLAFFFRVFNPCQSVQKALRGINRDEVEQQSSQLREAISTLQQGRAGEKLPGEEIFQALPKQLEQHYDERHGGFGGAPKFPQAPLLGLVQVVATAEGDASPADRMLHDALTRMALSGLRDHLGHPPVVRVQTGGTRSGDGAGRRVVQGCGRRGLSFRRIARDN